MPNKKALRRNETIKIVPKVWGEERWIHNDKLYCGKLLIVKKGKHCSLHYHKLKTETFYVTHGQLKVELTTLKNAKHNPPIIKESFELSKGEAIILKPNSVHRFTALTKEAHLFEFSTQHFDSDSHRIER